MMRSVLCSIQVDREEVIEPTHRTIGLDVGLVKMKRSQRLVSRKIKGSGNRRKARIKLARVHLKISRQRKDHAVKLARCVAASNDVIVYEDLRIKNMVKNHCLAKSINDAGWYQFRVWLEYFGKVFKRITIAVNPAYTSQSCSSCGGSVNNIFFMLDYSNLLLKYFLPNLYGELIKFW
jgi:putative transposase